MTLFAIQHILSKLSTTLICLVFISLSSTPPPPPHHHHPSQEPLFSLLDFPSLEATHSLSLLHPTARPPEQRSEEGKKKKEKGTKRRRKEGGLQPMSIPVVSEVTAAQWSH